MLILVLFALAVLSLVVECRSIIRSRQDWDAADWRRFLFWVTVGIAALVLYAFIGPDAPIP